MYLPWLLIKHDWAFVNFFLYGGLYDSFLLYNKFNAVWFNSKKKHLIFLENTLIMCSDVHIADTLR